MESLHNRVQGKTRKAEYWLTRLIDKFEEAKNLGVTDRPSQPGARETHGGAHALGMVDRVQRTCVP
jgi:nitrite reductase (cytochrome c-552)